MGPEFLTEENALPVPGRITMSDKITSSELENADDLVLGEREIDPPIITVPQLGNNSFYYDIIIISKQWIPDKPTITETEDSWEIHISTRCQIQEEK